MHHLHCTMSLRATLFAVFTSLVFPVPCVFAQSPATAATQSAASFAAAAQALVQRVVPSRAAQFSVEIIPKAENGHDVFEIESVGRKIVLRGNDGVSVASALNHYLKEVANCHLSWCGDRMDLPATLKPVPAKVRVVNPHRYRVMFNYCTLNYTASWWDQARWERELDFLAMQGINAPLGVIGLEAVWYDTLLKHGFNDEEARSFLVGPAYFAWQWMTNIEGHGGPLPRSWIESHRTMGKWWMNRARSLGMTPIRQGFSGFVPRALKTKLPQASVAIQPSWCAFPGSAQLDPLDPFFKQIGRTFMEESVRNFGEGHLWAADPFHESSPPRPGDQYLNEVGTAIFGLMREVDPKAIWAMQAWSIRKPITDSVPKGDLLVLDLSGGKNDFWGHNYVKGQLHNFGGRINLHGDLRDILANPFASQAAKDPHCIGMGLFPEAIMQNPVFYESVYDMIWRDKPSDPGAWLDAYALRRYGVSTENTAKAWRILLDEGPYKRGTSGTEASSMIAARPALDVKKSGPNTGFVMPYKPEKLVEALDLLLAESSQAGGGDAYRYDIVDLTRQVLSNLSQHLQKEIRLAYLAKNRTAFDKATAEFEGLLVDVDRLLATRPEFLFGKWLADARRFGTTPEEQALYEYNAAMLVTIWGPDPNPQIIDYSWREWSGLIGAFYLPRWRQFHAFLRTSIDKGDYRDPRAQVHGREAFRANDFYKKLANWELAFIRASHRALPATPQGNALIVAKSLREKYRARLSQVNNDDYRKLQNSRLDAAKLLLGKGISEAGKWSAERFDKGEKPLVLDVSGVVAADGNYEFSLIAGGGSGSLEFAPLVLTLNGEKVAESKGPFKMAAGSQPVKAQLSSGKNLINGKYELHLSAKLLNPATTLGGVVHVEKLN